MRIEILNLDGTVANTIVGSVAFAEAAHPGMWRIAPDQGQEAQQVQAPSAPRLVSVGAFYDRFGPLKFGVLASQDVGVQAVIKDSSVREYIDLDNPDTAAGIGVIINAGFDTSVAQVISDPVLERERPGYRS